MSETEIGTNSTAQVLMRIKAWGTTIDLTVGAAQKLTRKLITDLVSVREVALQALVDCGYIELENEECLKPADS